MIEYMEYAIDNDLIVMGKDGKPADIIEKNGEKIYKTNIDLFDEDEERWANQRPIEELIAERDAKLAEQCKGEEDILEKLKKGIIDTDDQ